MKMKKGILLLLVMVLVLGVSACTSDTGSKVSFQTVNLAVKEKGAEKTKDNIIKTGVINLKKDIKPEEVKNGIHRFRLRSNQSYVAQLSDQNDNYYSKEKKFSVGDSDTFIYFDLKSKLGNTSIYAKDQAGNQ